MKPVLLAAPHRPLFFIGIAQTLCVALWWLADLGGRYAGWYPPLAWALPPTLAHAHLMIYGVFPPIMFGFLMTAMPNWVGQPISRGEYLATFFLLAGGLALMDTGLWAGPTIFAAGGGLHLLGWAAGIAALARITFTGKARSKRDPLLILAALTAGWLGAAALPGWLLTQNPAILAFSAPVGIWLFLLPVFFTVGHRMIPFFSERALPGFTPRRAAWILPTVLWGGVIHGGLEWAGLSAWTWPTDLIMALAALRAAVDWGLRRCFAVRLLAMLHVSLATLAIALLLYALQSLGLALGNAPWLGRAPLHALTMGYFSAMLLAMVSRVSLGHSGRPLAADRLTWGCYWGLLAAAALRIAGEWPGAHLLIVAALGLWLACLAAWGIRTLPVYWRPRADGRPG